MDGLVDIHAHLLPGIDDGPAGLPDSVRMAKAASDSGIATMAVTPHLRSDFPDVHVEELAERCLHLREELAWAEVPLRIVSGAEVSLLWALEADEKALRLASYDQGGSDLLIETPSDVTGLERLLGSILARGFRVTLGHPERSPTLARDRDRIRALHDQGVLIQINADALLGRGGGGPRSTAERLCRDGVADVIASDGHRGTSWRPVTALQAAVRAAARQVGEPRATWMASEAPAAIIEGRPLPPPPPMAPRRRWWQVR